MWASRRVWTDVAVAQEEAGFSVLLDGRPVRTPGKLPLAVPTEALARCIAAEWDAQTETIDPTTMPATRMANSAIEKVTPKMAAVADHLAEYGSTDLLCYRAEGPSGLVSRQDRAWNKWLDWAESHYGARLVVTQGVIPVNQDKVALERLRDALNAFDAFALCAVHDLVTLPGSLILGLAAVNGIAEPDEIWNDSRIDELWQIEQWGADEEAEVANQKRLQAFRHAAAFLSLVSSGKS